MKRILFYALSALLILSIQAEAQKDQKMGKPDKALKQAEGEATAKAEAEAAKEKAEKAKAEAEAEAAEKRAEAEAEAAEKKAEAEEMKKGKADSEKGKGRSEEMKKATGLNIRMYLCHLECGGLTPLFDATRLVLKRCQPSALQKDAHAVSNATIQHLE